MNKKEQAIQFLKDSLKPDDILHFYNKGIKSLGPSIGWEFTYSIYIGEKEDGMNISHAVAHAINGMQINSGNDTKISIQPKDEDNIISYSDLYAINQLLWKSLGLPEEGIGFSFRKHKENR